MCYDPLRFIPCSAICFSSYTSALFPGDVIFLRYMKNNHNEYLHEIWFTNYTSALFFGDVLFLCYMQNNHNEYLHEIWFTNYTSALFYGCYSKSNHNAYCLRSFLPTTWAMVPDVSYLKTVTHSHARFV